MELYLALDQPENETKLLLIYALKGEIVEQLFSLVVEVSVSHIHDSGCLLMQTLRGSSDGFSDMVSATLWETWETWTVFLAPDLSLWRELGNVEVNPDYFRHLGIPTYGNSLFLSASLFSLCHIHTHSCAACSFTGH